MRGAALATTVRAAFPFDARRMGIRCGHCVRAGAKTRRNEEM